MSNFEVINRLAKIGVKHYPLGKTFYKYRTVERAKQILTENQIWFGTAKQMEDEFELQQPLLDLDYSDEVIEKFIKKIFTDANEKPIDYPKHLFKEISWKIIEDAKNYIGIFSAAKTPDNKHLWNKYADNNKGVCFGFTIPEKLFSTYNDLGMMLEAVYTNTPLSIKLIDENTLEYRIEKLYWLCAKYQRFVLEDEVRIIDVNGNGAKTFPKEILTDIVFGADSPKTEHDLILNLASEYNYSIQRIGIVR